MTGKILITKSKGFGFLISKDLPFKKIFFHWTALSNDTIGFESLKSGMKVSFTPIELEDGTYKAINIEVIDATIEEKDEQEGTREKKE